MPTSCCPRLLPAKKLGSPVPHLLRSFDLPSEREEILIHGTLADGREEMSRLGDEIHRTILLLANLSSQSSEVKKYVEEHQALVAPVRRVPAELMCEIFKLCLPDPQDVRDTPHSPLQAPLLLAQIDRRWRMIALSMPQLWSSITVAPTQTHGDTMLTTWLKRSMQCPLSLSLPHRSVGFWLYHSLLQFLVPHSERWQHVSFHITPSLHIVLAPIRGNLPSLVSLTLKSSDYEPISPFGVYEIAPQLRTVTVPDSIDFSNISLPWSQLTTWYGGANFDGCPTFFHDATNLVSCTFPDLRSPIAPPTAPIIHHSLVSLQVTSRDIDCISNFFSLLDLPVLRELSIRDADYNQWPHSLSFNAFLRRSPHLIFLSLDVRISPWTLIQILSDVPSLVELKITHSFPSAPSPLDKAALKQLADTPPDGECLVPNLRTLRLRGFFTVSDANLIPVILSRWQAGQRQDSGITALKVLHLSYYDPALVDCSLAARLFALKDKGLDVTVSSQGVRMFA